MRLSTTRGFTKPHAIQLEIFTEQARRNKFVRGFFEPPALRGSEAPFPGCHHAVVPPSSSNSWPGNGLHGLCSAVPMESFLYASLSVAQHQGDKGHSWRLITAAQYAARRINALFSEPIMRFRGCQQPYNTTPDLFLRGLIVPHS